MILSYTDSGVVIAAWRHDSPLCIPARRFLTDSSRKIVASPLVRLETLPKASYRKNADELAYYEAVFASVREWVQVDDALVESAIDLGRRYDIVNLDALHVAAAIRAGVDQFVTTEKPGKPLYRVTELQIVDLFGL